MSVRRQGNWLSQQRVDVPHLRALESSIAADFDTLTGVIISGRDSYVISGLEIDVSGVDGPAESLQLIVAGSKLFHFNGSESGTMYVFGDDDANEILSATNSKVVGAFVPSTTHYVGLDLRREVDAASADIVQFLDADTKQETPKVVPLSRVMTYRIIISLQPFAANPYILPICIVNTASNGNVINITDSRPLLFSLSSGGDSPDLYNYYHWADRTRNGTYIANIGNPNPFTSGDKEFTSMKDWMNAVMTRIWESAGGEHWAAPNAERDVKIAYGTPTLVVNNQNWYFDGTTLSWSGIKILFSNSTAMFNTVVDNAAGVAIADGQCLYVDVNRGQDAAAVVPAVGGLINLGQSTIPGQRYVLAWRIGSNVFYRDYGSNGALAFPVAKTVYTKGEVFLSSGFVHDGFKGTISAGVGNKALYSLKLPVGAIPTAFHIYGRFGTVGPAGSQFQIQARYHSQLTSTVKAGVTVTSTAAPQFIEASTVADVTGTHQAGPGEGNLKLIPTDLTIAMALPNNIVGTSYYTVTLEITCTIAGATNLEIYGIGVEYSMSAVNQG